MTVRQAFAPKRGANQNLTATTTSQIATVGTGEKSLRIVNKAGGGDLFIYTYRATSSSDVRPASTADYCVVAGQSSVITKYEFHDTVAYITDTGTAVFKLQPGEGM